MHERSRIRVPAGVALRVLDPHVDSRGAFTEIFREEWKLGVEPVQWNFVRSQPGTLRGVHVHPRHADYLVLLAGRATFGLKDLRPGSPTEGLAATIEMDGAAPAGLAIPAGVGHGFLFHEPSIHVYAVSRYWDVADELGCRWDDPDLGIAWPRAPSRVSERDRRLPDLAALRAGLGTRIGAR